MKLQLLPHSTLVKTSDVDHAEWNYRPLLGFVQRTRFKLVCSLLAGRKFDRLLEAGYGSGVLMPQLKLYANEIWGIDPHPYPKEVEAALAGHGVYTRLFSGGIQGVPFENSSFDCVLAVSALEYVDELDHACREIKRILRPGGVLVLVTPGQSPLLDLALRIVGEDAADNYGDRRAKLIPALLRHFEVDASLHWPRWSGRLFRVYTALRLKPTDRPAEV